MKEIYSWVPWFRELAEKISREGEKYLIKKAKQVAWGKSRALVDFGDEAIDPLSFFYFLASKNTSNQLKPVYDSVSEVFEINPLDTDLDDVFYYPTPKFKILFHDGKKPNSNLLWRLFRQAMEDKPQIASGVFMEVLNIQNVGVPKLTQTLFLVNPHYFLPVDSSSADVSAALNLRAQSEIKDEGFDNYRSFLNKLKGAFPGCEPYEINMFLYLQNTGDLELSGDFYQVSTQVMGNNEGDYWDDGEDNFKDNYWVYTGGPGDDKLYPLADPKQGDVILVRTGREKGKAKGRAIGVVYQNDYVLDGWNEKRRIHVLWINKSEGKLAENTPILGFSKAGTKTREAFDSIKNYGPSFDLIGKLKKSSSANEPKSIPETQPPEADSKKNRQPLNQILYGPPGTSKTWNTVDYALAIIEGEPREVIAKRSREDKLRRFDELKANGQIEMVTFHQSYNYEDFIEGIRPVLAGDGEGSVEYELSEGVFRQISERAEENARRSAQTEGESWDIDELLQSFAKSIDEKLVSDEPIDLFPPDRKRVTRIVKVNWSRDGIFKSVNAGTEKSWRYLTRDVIKEYYIPFYSGEIRSEKVIRPTRKSKQTQHSHAHYYYALFEKIREFHDEEWQPDEHGDIEPQNYVLIIDEINRGNIAKIFGELITLIEDSKRTGGDDAATVTLPYSKEEFGVPDNLYIIGTMNTADRSIALLDTALRRRFHFVEMMPDPKLVPEDIQGVNCQKLLEAMNNRIRFLLDREHQIGHTYLMNVKSIDSLASTFKTKIIPLLQEYFYDNWEKIELVLNRNGFIDKRNIPDDLRAEDQLIDVEKKVYEVLPAADNKWRDPESYKAIYRAAKVAADQAS